jgi:hypothetical protein
LIFFSLWIFVDGTFKPLPGALYNWSLSHKFGPRNADEFHPTFVLNSLDNNCLSDFTKQKKKIFFWKSMNKSYDFVLLH